MNKFIEKFGALVQGSTSGFDRLVFRGTLRGIQYIYGMMGYLWNRQVLLKDFGKLAQTTTEQIKKASLREAKRLERPTIYLNSSKVDKKGMAEQIVIKDQIETGLICVLSCVEPCLSFDVGPNKASRRIELKYRLRKCLFLYHYWMHPVFGFMSARIQTWFPFQVQIYLNGREWLSRQMDQAGLNYIRHENCFPWIEDYARAQALMEEQQKTNWSAELDAICGQLNPVHDEVFAGFATANYYWSVSESEWATDVCFRGGMELQRLFPHYLELGMTGFGSGDVMKFLGHKVNADGSIHGNFEGEVVTDLKRRPEGARVKHRVEQNSVKMYDKAHQQAGSVLRIETTLNNVRPFRGYRATESNPEGEKKWRPMRRGVADLHRRGEVSQQINDRYLEALAGVDDSQRLHEILSPLAKRTDWKGHPVRGLHPFSEQDSKILEVIGLGELMIHGISNQDLRDQLFAAEARDAKEAKRRSAQISRKIRLLRAHGILRKIQGRNLYRVTDTGRVLLTAFLIARQASVNQLMKKAA